MITGRRFHASVLYTFEQVYRLGSIREAARTLHIASSAVSRQIQKLEDDLDIKLFERLPNGLKLTSAGESFARHVQIVLQDSERFYSEIQALKGLQKGHIEVATIEGPSVELLPRIIASFRERYPLVTIGVTVTGSDASSKMIVNGEADIAIAFDLERHQDLNQIWMGRFALGAVVNMDHPLASLVETDFDTCSQYPLIVSKSGLSIYKHIAYLINQLSPSHQLIASNSVELARKLALRGMGIAFQSRIGIEGDITNGLLTHIPITAPTPIITELGIYVRANRTLPVAVDYFARELSLGAASLADAV